MKLATGIILGIATIFQVGIAATMALKGINDWGWFLFTATITAYYASVSVS